MGSISHMNSRLHDLRVSVDTVEICSHQATIPGPVIFSITGRVYTHISTTSPNIALKRSFLVIIEYLAGSQQEDNSVVVCQIRIRKNAGIFRKINLKFMFRSQLSERYLSILDRGMAETTRLRKNEQPPGAWIVCSRRTTSVRTGLLSIASYLSHSRAGSMNEVTACSLNNTTESTSTSERAIGQGFLI